MKSIFIGLGLALLTTLGVADTFDCHVTHSKLAGHVSEEVAHFAVDTQAPGNGATFSIANASYMSWCSSEVPDDNKVLACSLQNTAEGVVMSALEVPKTTLSISLETFIDRQDPEALTLNCTGS